MYVKQTLKKLRLFYPVTGAVWLEKRNSKSHQFAWKAWQKEAHTILSIDNCPSIMVRWSAGIKLQKRSDYGPERALD